MAPQHGTSAHRTDTDIISANLSGVDFSGANLRGVDLRHAIGLTREQIESANIDETTLLPDELQ